MVQFKDVAGMTKRTRMSQTMILPFRVLIRSKRGIEDLITRGREMMSLTSY